MLAMQMNCPEMNADDVCRIYETLKTVGVQVWVDGGCVSMHYWDDNYAPHDDLDIAVDNADLGKLTDWLTANDFKRIRTDSEWNWVVSDGPGERLMSIFLFTDQTIKLLTESNIQQNL